MATARAGAANPGVKNFFGPRHSIIEVLEAKDGQQLGPAISKQLVAICLNGAKPPQAQPKTANHRETTNAFRAAFGRNPANGVAPDEKRKSAINDALNHADAMRILYVLHAGFFLHDFGNWSKMKPDARASAVTRHLSSVNLTLDGPSNELLRTFQRVSEPDLQLLESRVAANLRLLAALMYINPNFFSLSRFQVPHQSIPPQNLACAVLYFGVDEVHSRLKTKLGEPNRTKTSQDTYELLQDVVEKMTTERFGEPSSQTRRILDRALVMGLFFGLNGPRLNLTMPNDGLPPINPALLSPFSQISVSDRQQIATNIIKAANTGVLTTFTTNAFNLSGVREAQSPQMSFWSGVRREESDTRVPPFVVSPPQSAAPEAKPQQEIGLPLHTSVGEGPLSEQRLLSALLYANEDLGGVFGEGELRLAANSLAQAMDAGALTEYSAKIIVPKFADVDQFSYHRLPQRFNASLDRDPYLEAVLPGAVWKVEGRWSKNHNEYSLVFEIRLAKSEQ